MEAFLLPSLVTAILFLSNYLWVDPHSKLRPDQPSEQRAIIKLLQLILLPSAISNEGRTILRSVMNTIAKPLELALRAFQRREPANREVEPLLKVLRESIPLSRRTGAAEHHELETWAGAQSGGLVGTLRHTIHGFVQWSLHPGVNVMPTSYTHRQFFAAMRILGARRILYLILDEIRQHAGGPGEAVMYDVATAVICAPDGSHATAATAVTAASTTAPHNLQRRLSLRDALRLEAEDSRHSQRTDPALAEIVVRLHRRVESQMAVPSAGDAMLPDVGDALTLELGDDASVGLGDAMAAAVVAAADAMAMDGVGLDLGGMGQQPGAGTSGAAAGAMDLSGDGDIFAGLSGETDLLGWDGMDVMDLA